MFKKLKDKIAEEVKISPQRIQQFTQSVTDKLQSNSNDESHFSISEDDTVQTEGSTTNADAGYTNVTLHASGMLDSMRRNSNSSLSSDISFLPRYESSINMYHMQSDLDVSASEVEDNISSASSQLGHVSKEQVYSAFQKAQMRYHKYRGRYTDLASHYKELERENAKMKAVLVETQDKAIRRMSELREQCSLSQKAKADLEQALRTEIEEKQIVISTLKDKVDLLQNDRTTHRETESEDTRTIQELKANAIVLQSKEADAKEKIALLEKSLSELRNRCDELEERQRADNLKFAESKMELHAELQNKDTEIGSLKRELEAAEARLDGNLKTQNLKLIEKCETLAAKCQAYEADAIKGEQRALEVKALQEERLTWRRQTDELVNETERLRLELCAKDNEIRWKEEEAKEIAERTNEELQQNVEESEKYRKEADTLKSELETTRQEYESLQEQTKQRLLSLESRIRDKLEDIYKEKEILMQSDFQSKLDELKANDEDSKETQIKLMQCEERSSKLQTKVEELDATLEKRVAAYGDLESNHLDLIKENNRRQVENTELMREVRKLKADLETQCDKFDSTLKQETEKYEKHISKLQSKVNELEESNRSLLGKEADLTKKYSSLELENQQLSDALRSNNECNEDLKSVQSAQLVKLKDLNDENQVNHKIIDELNVKIVELKEEIGALTSKCHIMKEQLEQNNAKQIKVLNEKVAEFKELEAQYESVLAENHKLKIEIVQLMELKDKVEVIKNDNELKTASIGEAQAEIQKLKGEAAMYKEDGERLGLEIEQLRSAIKDVSIEKQNIFKQYEALCTTEKQQRDLLSDAQENGLRLSSLRDEISKLEARNAELSGDNRRSMEENDRLLAECSELRERCDTLVAAKNCAEEKMVNSAMSTKKLQEEVDALAERNAELLRQVEALSPRDDDGAENLREKLSEISDKYERLLEDNRNVKTELSNVTGQLERLTSDKNKLETQLTDLEKHCNELVHEKQLLKDEIEELKISPLNLRDENDDSTAAGRREIESLREKLAQYKSIDATNRSSIEFYETELQKMCNRNEKLNRKLDETLVTLNHCATLSASTEIEYLKNVLYNYMLGKESMVMARVLAAVCKFDTQQTETVLKHEQHKQSLLGQLGIL